MQYILTSLYVVRSGERNHDRLKKERQTFVATIQCPSIGGRFPLCAVATYETPLGSQTSNACGDSRFPNFPWSLLLVAYCYLLRASSTISVGSVRYDSLVFKCLKS